MDASYDGRQVVGIDLHRRRSVIVRMTEDGRKLETVRITNSPAALRREIARAGQHPRVVAGATYGDLTRISGSCANFGLLREFCDGSRLVRWPGQDGWLVPGNMTIWDASGASA